MLNPSTADENVDDPTIASVSRLALKNGFGNLLVLNLFALRATDQKVMWESPAAIGPNNWKTWKKVIGGLDDGHDAIALAWGRPPNKKSYKNKFRTAIHQASQCLAPWQGQLQTWIINADQSPRHPLYIKSDTPLQTYSLDRYLQKLS